MKITELVAFPTTVNSAKHGRVHESVLRSFQLVRKLEEWLQCGVSAKICLELIDEVMGAEQSDFEGVAKDAEF
jgi:hypothetical protein